MRPRSKRVRRQTRLIDCRLVERRHPGVAEIGPDRYDEAHDRNRPVFGFVSMPDAADAVGARLEIDRKDLLDLSLRSPLLNYRPRVRGLEIVGEVPPEVFRILVREGKAMTFLPAPVAEPAMDPPGE